MEALKRIPGIVERLVAERQIRSKERRIFQMVIRGAEKEGWSEENKSKIIEIYENSTREFQEIVPRLRRQWGLENQ